MAVLHFADFQIRLLLCTPIAKEPIPPESPLRGLAGARLRWNCGCSAVECAHRKYAVEPCDEHLLLLKEIPEDEEPIYDSRFSSAPSDYSKASWTKRSGSIRGRETAG